MYVSSGYELMTPQLLKEAARKNRDLILPNLGNRGNHVSINLPTFEERFHIGPYPGAPTQ